MKTVQMTLEPTLLTQVDRVARQLGLTRSAFTRQALRAAIERARIEVLERRLGGSRKCSGILRRDRPRTISWSMTR